MNLLKTTLCSLFLFGSLFAQAPVQLTFSSGNSVKIGFSGSRDITITSTSGNQPAGVQFTLTWPATVSNVALIPASQATAAGKGVTCGNAIVNPDTTSSMACLVTGVSTSLVQNGPPATVTFTVVKGTSTTSGTLSLASLTPQPPLSVSLLASPIVTSGGAVSVPFVRVEDINSDGKVDITDLQLVYQQVLGFAPCGTADVNADGKCDLVDAQLVVKAILGL